MNSSKELPQREFYRLCDANLNRLREALRVLEDIFRFIYDNKKISKTLKTLRHLARVDNYKSFLEHRDIIGDVLKENTKSEFDRKNIEDILIANFKRAQESSRTLEESLKLVSHEDSAKFKNIRYQLYDIEKEILLIPN